MSIYTKKTVIVWQKDTYMPVMMSEIGTTPAGPAFDEFSNKTAEMIAAGVMSEDGEVKILDPKLTSIKFFTDETAAQEWITFNDELAAKYGFIKVSSAVRSVV